MFTRILYLTDFSDVSKKALAYIKQLKEAVVLHVIDERQIEAVFLYARGNSCVFMDTMEQEARREVGAIEKEFRDYGFCGELYHKDRDSPEGNIKGRRR